MAERSINEAYRGRHQREEEGNAIGLTEAFSFVEDDFEEEVPERDYFDDPVDDSFDAQPPSDDWGYSDEEPEEEPVRRGRHARHARIDDDEFADDYYEFDEPAVGVIGAAAEQQQAAPDNRRRRRSKKKTRDGETPLYVKKSRRMRKILIGAIVALILLGAAGAFYTYQLFDAAQTAAEEKAAETTPVDQDIESEATDDASTVAAKKVEIPNLASLLGLPVDKALAQLGEGAQVTSSMEFNAEGERPAEDEEVVGTEVTVSLSGGASDARMGYPSVFLTLDSNGEVSRVGYSASTTLLGVGEQSFEDVITNGHIVETCFDEVGVSIPAGDVSLPADKAAYTTYAEDGTTLVKEYCSFGGETEYGEGSLHWSAVLSYDYTMYNATGNLKDTVRVIYLYVE